MKAAALALVVVLMAGSSAWAQVRESILAGQWYPADPDELRQEVRGYLDGAAEQGAAGQGGSGELLALVSPHAGYVYSAGIAAHGYALLAGHEPDTVVIVAPSHRARFDAVSVYDRGGYQTPLGLVELDEGFIGLLEAADPMIRYVPEAHAEEHAVEIQLPLLQVAAPGFRVVPLVMGRQDLEACRRLSAALARAASQSRGRVLLVASSDLSHFHDAATAASLDGVVAARVAAMDAEGLFADLAAGNCEACGGGPIVAVMLAAQAMGADTAEILAQGDSSAASGDESRVVGYLSAALWDTDGSGPAEAADVDEEAAPLLLTDAEKQTLLDLARESVAREFEDLPLPEPDEITPSLAQVRGAFVTFHLHGQLRGCIGQIIGQYPLHETVARMARAAAFNDPRFPPMSREEFEAADMEISALTPLQPVDEPAAVRVGVDGLLATRGFRSGVLLPQVPVEQGWDRIQFLSYTCMKANMDQDCWLDPETTLYTFQAEVF